MRKTLYILFILFTLAYIVWSLGLMHDRGILSNDRGLNMERMVSADSAIYQAIADGEFPGAVLCVVRRAADGEQMGCIEYLKAYGNRSVLSQDGKADTLPMTEDAVFDLASLSKCVGTTLAFMRLVEDGKVRLTDRVDRYIENFKPWDSLAQPTRKIFNKRQKSDKQRVLKREHITIQHLLTHTSGLPAYVSAAEVIGYYKEYSPENGALRDSLITYIATEVDRKRRPGTKVRYSCLNFITLQAIIETVTGSRLDKFAEQEVFEPLGLKNTWYNDIDATERPFSEETPIVPTELQRDGKVLFGEVHDPTARIINRGVSGNAGVFSTAEDLAVVASMLMNGGILRFKRDGWQGKLGMTEVRRFYSEQTVNRFFQIPDFASEYTRALGWDAAYDRGGCYGDLMTPNSVASHTGYTGTSMAIDYKRGVAVILLTNRVHPKDKGSLSRTRAVVANIAMSALE